MKKNIHVSRKDKQAPEPFKEPAIYPEKWLLNEEEKAILISQTNAAVDLFTAQNKKSDT